MFGYSVTRPLASKAYFHQIFDTADDVNCQVEGWHTESGPGVFEAVSLAVGRTCFGQSRLVLLMY